MSNYFATAIDFSYLEENAHKASPEEVEAMQWVLDMKDLEDEGLIHVELDENGEPRIYPVEETV